jgi:hypothetical protein
MGRVWIMKGNWVGLVVLAGVLTAMLVQGANAAGRPSCLVSNERTRLGMQSLQAGIDAAAAGDTLVVKGTCVGTSTIAKDLMLKGVRNRPFGVATLDGDGLGSVLTVTGGVTVAIADLVVTNGTATEGGGIANRGSTLTMSGSIVSENTSRQDGGGVLNSNGSTLTLDNSTVSGNVAGFGGGGIFSENGSRVTLNNSTVIGNAAEFPGGGLFSYNGGGGEVTLNNSTLSGNTTESNGGGIAFIFGTVTLNDSTVTGNTARYSGGGVYNAVGTFTLVGSSMVNANIAGLNGGGIFNSGGTLINCISGVNVSGNTPDNIYP